jgi:hypothetical protein
MKFERRIKKKERKENSRKKENPPEKSRSGKPYNQKLLH